MKTSYFVCAATAFAAVVGGASAWPGKTPPVAEIAQLVRAKPLADTHISHLPPELPPIVVGPNEPVIPAPVVIPASASVPQLPPMSELPKVPPPPMLPAPPLPPVPVVPVPPIVDMPKLPAVPPPAIPMAVAPPAPLTPPQKLPIVPPPSTLPAPTPFVPPAAPGIGSVVLLTDGKVVEGTVTRAGDKILVRRGSIDQPFAKDQVQFIGKSKEECYTHLLGKVNADDAPGRFKLARWCMYNGLREQALLEAQTVVKLQPNHAMAAAMARSLEESIRLFNGDGTSKVPSPEAPKPGLPKAVDADPEIATDAANTFGPRVQPVLANLCADCHAKPGYTGAFKLACGTGADHDPGIAKQNLRAVLAQIKKADPASSPLLEKSLAAHGGMKQAAFANRQAPAFRVLEAWVVLAASSAPATSAPVPMPVLPPPPAPKPVEQPNQVLPPVPPPPAVKFGEDAKPAAGTVNTVDEFDPGVFNRAVLPN